MTSSDIIKLLNQFGGRLPSNLRFAVSDKGEIEKDHPLYAEIYSVLNKRTASLPYPVADNVMWVTTAPSPDELRRVIEDLRCWILPSFGWEASPAVISDAAASGALASSILALSPQGYFRWNSRPSDLDTIVSRLSLMRQVVTAAPPRKSVIRLTLGMLRRQFTLGIVAGDRDLALRAIDEIDQRQLDTAANALAMRMRLAADFGDYKAIVDHPQLDDLLSIRVSQSAIDSILIAHYMVFLADYESAGDIKAAVDGYAQISDRLAGLARPPSDTDSTVLVHMAAYDAHARGDSDLVLSLARRFSADGVIQHLAALNREELSSTINQSETIEDISYDAKADFSNKDVAKLTLSVDPDTTLAADGWSNLPELVLTKASERLAIFLRKVELAPDTFDPGTGDFIYDLFTNAEIAQDAESKTLQDDTLTTVIDAYICEDRFPRRERMPLYQAVLDVWSSTRSLSSDAIDGQLLLTIADALLRLDGILEKVAAKAIENWWSARPIRARLSWLAEALELLTEQSASQDYLSLWYAGAALIKMDRQEVALTDRFLWNRLGRRLGLDSSTANDALGVPEGIVENDVDPLRRSSFKKIAIVSLHERAAREAATQIGERCDAEVIVVTDHAAGERTSLAATADVILFVWGATKHAVYRAFDKVRDRLEYVQGTGSASIIRALERRIGNAQI